MTETQTDSQLTTLQVGEEEGSSSEYTDDDVEEFGDIHRMVLQVIYYAGWLDVKGVRKVFQESCKYLKCEYPSGEHLSPTFIQKVVREINEKTKEFGLMVRSATCEVTGEKCYLGLVTQEKIIMRMQTYFTKSELDLFQMIIKSVLQKHNDFLIPMIECINLASELNHDRFSKVDAEDFVNKMVGLKYFVKVYKDKEEFEITLGCRTIREFETIFLQMYSEYFGNCALCKTILLNGAICPSCPAVYHHTCLKKYIKACKNCVGCNEKWKNEESLSKRTLSNSARGGGLPTLIPGPQKSQERASKTVVSGQSAKNAGKKTNTGKTRDQVDMPTLEPMVAPKNSAGTRESSISKKNKDAPKAGPSSSKGKNVRDVEQAGSSSK